MAESGCFCRRRWKRHIVRQLQQRDRAQTALFRDLVQAYTSLLEKSSLDDVLPKLQAPSLDHQLDSPPSSPSRASPTCFLEGALGPGPALSCLQRGHEANLQQLEAVNGELAYKIYERNRLLQAKEATLREQRDRLAILSGQLSELQARGCRLRDQAEELSRRNGALKEDYGQLRSRFQLEDGDFRRAAEKGRRLLQGILQRKVEAAKRENERIERLKQDRLNKELQEAAKSTVKMEQEKGKVEEQKLASRNAPEEKKSGEKLWRRPFRSASATSITTARDKGVVRGWFDFRLKRGNSVQDGEADRYCCLPSCVAVCLPSRVADEQEAHQSEINAVNFSPDSGMLATGGTDQLIQLWNVVGGSLEKMQILEGASGSITSVEFDPSGHHILAATYKNTAQLWKVGDGQFKEILTGHTDKVTAAKFRSTWRKAVTGSRDRTVKEWDLGRGACSRTIQVFSYCNDVVCCNNVIVSGHHDKRIRFWDSRDPRCTQVIPVEGKVTSLSLSPDQLQLLSCSRDNSLKVIDLRTHNIRQVFRADGFQCGSDGTKAVFSPEKSYTLAGSSDGTLFLWNVATGELEASLAGAHRSSVNAVAWAPSGRYIASVDQCRKVVLWR